MLLLRRSVSSAPGPLAVSLSSCCSDPSFLASAERSPQLTTPICVCTATCPYSGQGHLSLLHALFRHCRCLRAPASLPAPALRLPGAHLGERRSVHSSEILAAHMLRTQPIIVSPSAASRCSISLSSGSCCTSWSSPTSSARSPAKKQAFLPFREVVATLLTTYKPLAKELNSITNMKITITINTDENTCKNKKLK